MPYVFCKCFSIVASYFSVKNSEARLRMEINFSFFSQLPSYFCWDCCWHILSIVIVTNRIAKNSMKLLWMEDDIGGYLEMMCVINCDFSWNDHTVSHSTRPLLLPLPLNLEHHKHTSPPKRRMNFMRWNENFMIIILLKKIYMNSVEWLTWCWYFFFISNLLNTDSVG